MPLIDRPEFRAWLDRHNGRMVGRPHGEIASCMICGGTGCSACKGTGWIEIMGAGMVHPAVFEHVGYDAERYTGFAFGMGPARIAMLRYGIPDIRLLYDTDVRFLEQFSGAV